MPNLGLATSTVRRSRGELPQLPLVNMFAEAAITEPERFSLLSRPGFSGNGQQYGDGPIRALFRQQGVLNGRIIAVSDTDFYVDGERKGLLAGSGAANLAGNEIGVIGTAGETVSFWDGTNYRSVAFPDNANVTRVAEQGGRFIFLRAQSHRYYWTKPYTAMINGSGDIVVDPLDYASAENEPDHLLDILVIEDSLVLFGQNTIEFHAETGQSAAPWAPMQGRVYQKGIRASGCAAHFDNSFAWVSEENIVYRAGNVPLAISDEGIVELISGSLNCQVTSFYLEGNEFLKIDLDTVSLVYGAKSQQWAEWSSNGGPLLGGVSISGPVFGSVEDGKLLIFSEYDDLGAAQVRRFRAGLPANGGTMTIDNLGIRTNPGQTNYTVGDYADPIVEARLSRDGGQTWGLWRQTSLGKQGVYRKRPEWRSWGVVDAPGVLFEFRVADPVSFRVSGAFYNEQMGGRGRG
ncbi:packaged DNA stabilization protein [Caenibius sp. WL]|uniref:packaged DNA stabilization protein n=1 Tax=Caenibius sp. WL TaxID=2872646 RepID=UPI001C993C96|nr:packaged DNA stabilization protein [Caenibius sp. WL]QZP07774.1 packaged DNA stabilization protein gp10 [Caenibius sp. WL]QZP09993.1 packaged DNA stabilization protein gp10 [Caenibius sp. WL]